MVTQENHSLDREHLLMQGVLQRAIREYGTNSNIPRIIRRLFYDRTWLFIPSALQLIRNEPDSPGRRFVTVLLLNSADVITRLTNPHQHPREDTMFYMRRFMETDPFMDIRLAKQLPGKDGAIDRREMPSAVRVLDVLDEISPGRRLIPILGYLTRYPDPLLAGKATMLIARRISNASWIRRHMTSGDSRVRANVVEGLWGIDAPYVRPTNLDALHDANNRVVGNALIGLHLAKEHGVDRRVLNMTRDNRIGFRSTAAWVLGRLGNRDHIDHVQRLLKDDSFAVRRAALRALFAMRPGPESAVVLAGSAARDVREEVAEASVPDSVLPPQVGAPPPPEESVRVDLRLDGSSFRIRK